MRKRNGKTEEVVRRQTIEGLKGLSEREIGRTVIAYEPIWAIGTGRSATADDANGIIGYIREILEKIARKETADTIRILYGGSVKPANAASLLGQPHIDGALVGAQVLRRTSFGNNKHNSGKEIG